MQGGRGGRAEECSGEGRQECGGNKGGRGVVAGQWGLCEWGVQEGWGMSSGSAARRASGG